MGLTPKNGVMIPTYHFENYLAWGFEGYLAQPTGPAGVHPAPFVKRSAADIKWPIIGIRVFNAASSHLPGGVAADQRMIGVERDPKGSLTNLS